MGCGAGCWLVVFGFCVVVPSLCFGFLLGGLVFGEFGDCCFVVNFVCFPVVLFCDGALLTVSWWWVVVLPIVLLVVVVLVVTNLVCRWACCVGTVAGLLRSGCFLGVLMRGGCTLVVAVGGFGFGVGVGFC